MKSLAILALLMAAQAHADSFDPRVIKKNKDANASFRKKDYVHAQESLADALTVDAADPYTRFNWATNKMFSAIDEQNSNKVSPKIAEEATKEFENLNKDLQRQSPGRRAPIEKQLHYQMGQAYELTKNYDKALENYYQSLLSGKSGAELDSHTKNNIARLLAEQQGNGGGGGDQNQQQQKQGGGQGNDKQQGDGKDKQKLKDGEDANQNKQKPRFDQTDVSEQEARQIMESVKGEEQDVQKRKTQAEARMRASKDGEEKGNPSEFNGKQW